MYCCSGPDYSSGDEEYLEANSYDKKLQKLTHDALHTAIDEIAEQYDFDEIDKNEFFNNISTPLRDNDVFLTDLYSIHSVKILKPLYTFLDNESITVKQYIDYSLIWGYLTYFDNNYYTVNTFITQILTHREFIDEKLTLVSYMVIAFAIYLKRLKTLNEKGLLEYKDQDELLKYYERKINIAFDKEIKFTYIVTLIEKDGDLLSDTNLLKLVEYIDGAVLNVQLFTYKLPVGFDTSLIELKYSYTFGLLKKYTNVHVSLNITYELLNLDPYKDEDFDDMHIFSRRVLEEYLENGNKYFFYSNIDFINEVLYNMESYELFKRHPQLKNPKLKLNPRNEEVKLQNRHEVDYAIFTTEFDEELYISSDEDDL